MPTDIMQITRKEININKDINLFIRKGYKITFVLLDGSKTIFTTTPTLDLTNTNSDDIKKLLANTESLIVETI